MLSCCTIYHLLNVTSSLNTTVMILLSLFSRLTLIGLRIQQFSFKGGRKQKPVGRAKGRTESGVHTRTECCKSVFQSSSCELLSQILRNLLLVVVT